MLRLTPDPATDAPALPETDADVTKRALKASPMDEPLGLPASDVAVLRVRTGHFTLNVSANTLRRADRLVVTFLGPRPGARSPVVSRRPMFARRRWDALFGCPILAISDPLAEVEISSAAPRSGLYFGTFEHDLVPEILALINKACDELGVDRGRVVLYGASFGGTAAMLVGARRVEPTAVIATCPQLRPDRYREQVLHEIVKAARGTMADWDEVARNAPWRTNPLTAMRDAFQEGRDLRVYIAQNVKDKTTVNKHFAGLWRRFDVSPEGGVSSDGRLMAALYDRGADDSGIEPRELSHLMIRQAYAFFDAPVVAQPRRERKRAEAEDAVDDADDDLDGDD